MFKTRFIAAIAIAVAAVGANAQASLIFNGMSQNKYGTATITINGKTETVYAGPQSVTLQGTNQTFDAYCVDLMNWNTFGDCYAVDINNAAGSSANNAAKISWMYDQLAGKVTNATEGSALQLAIWDVLTDNGDGLNTGNFLASGVSADVFNQAGAYLDFAKTFNGIGGDAAFYEAVNHPGGRYQDLVGKPVPEPATMLGLLGLAGIALRRRFNKK